MSSSTSLTKQLTASVLLLELVAAVSITITAWNHERHVQFETFKANIKTHSNVLFGGIQEAPTKDGSIALYAQGISIPSTAVYSVTESDGTVLAVKGDMPHISLPVGAFAEAQVGGESYLFYRLSGERVIDPGKNFEVHHQIQVVLGLPIHRVWHEVYEAVRFFIIATIVLLGLTAVLMIWLIRRLLRPIRELATEADNLDTITWTFVPPPSSKNLTELLPLASAIEKSIARLHQSFQQQRRFTSDAAHELKTDLAIVKSSLQVLMMKQRTVEEYQQGLSLILADTGRLEATVLRMLTLSRLEQSNQQESNHCDFAEVVLEAIAQSQPLLDYKLIKVATAVVADGTEVSLSQEDALLLCSNILMNAVQHSPSSSRIDVTLKRDDEFVVLSIRDFGDGVSDEDLPFLFEPFYRGDESRSRKTGGTGLGLAICKAVCDRSCGNISIANHYEGGALVEVRLPIAIGG